MYKILGIIFCAILLAFFSPSTDFVANFASVDGTFYFSTAENFSAPNTQTTQNGRGFIISTPSSSVARVYRDFDREKIDGIALTTTQKLDIDSILSNLHAKTLFCEKIDGLLFLYAYTYKFPKFITYNGAKINLQICVRDSSTTIGYPAILIGA